MNAQFLKELHQAKDEVIKQVNAQPWDNALRTSVETLVILIEQIESHPKQLSEEPVLLDEWAYVMNERESQPKQLSYEEIRQQIDGIGWREHSSFRDMPNGEYMEVSDVMLLAKWIRDRTGGEVDEQVERFKRYRYLAWKIQYGRGLNQDEYEQYEELREEMQYNVADYLTQRNQQEND